MCNPIAPLWLCRFLLSCVESQNSIYETKLVSGRMQKPARAESVMDDHFTLLLHAGGYLLFNPIKTVVGAFPTVPSSPLPSGATTLWLLFAVGLLSEAPNAYTLKVSSPCRGSGVFYSPPPFN